MRGGRRSRTGMGTTNRAAPPSQQTREKSTHSRSGFQGGSKSNAGVINVSQGSTSVQGVRI